MKKIIALMVLIVAIVIGGGTTYLIKTEKMVWQTPALVHEDAKVTFVVGDVKVQYADGAEWKHLLVGEDIFPGYTIKTAEGALVDIRFHAKMAIRITEKSIMKIDNNTIKNMQVNLSEGALYGKFKKIYPGHSLKIRTVTCVAAVRGTELGFEIGEQLPPTLLTTNTEAEPDLKDKKEKKDEELTAKKDKAKPEDTPIDGTATIKIEPLPSTRVYALSGITEVYNFDYSEQKVLLSYQKQIDILKGYAAGETSDISEEDISRIRKILNSIHFEEVLLISDKILFKSGSATILAESFEELNKIVVILKEKGISIRIEGHTDNIGEDAKNQQLSLERAESIKTYLIENGIEAERLIAAGFGESNPITDNSTKEKRSQNRRVEFIIVAE